MNYEKERIIEDKVIQMEKEGRVTGIKISWCARDILSVDSTLTPEQVEDVLTCLENKHDCNVGITWNVIQYFIDYIKGE